MSDFINFLSEDVKLKYMIDFSGTVPPILTEPLGKLDPSLDDRGLKFKPSQHSGQ